MLWQRFDLQLGLYFAALVAAFALLLGSAWGQQVSGGVRFAVRRPT
jgi:hypothetical protein